ncbi:bifunctional 4-hydroxy-3-methylbut-2-enyl diphosphate reductase/30S ribosomal protein S1 [Fusobacterium animalis]|uniref:bifunctional 4-hydroxy-3-methylbut-2-enyl diphosphate reductase/30S ribosomal protein S1 n=1 Tax=Fusobacterium TaxID=848 RepID=UPI0002137C3E|nr:MULTISPECIES: bifunctional 4-hydroxy-3-methylbut-2-enyl diphosphate reductase/30S ribosomal protein S1 [Fusobacterium]EGN66120.1 4-hydroxy-3-methylbut-2-enyl diphosphate reductase [Fusobacterium animalis 21_1A]ERT38796.1 4-hydroxy-3-methylbut-2-enyl diphosphate reductase [Fusobacterium nucleatum CTI-3]ERT38837.1 4-hydroxy-3-methylbut-2-enyl diphosphate reductase [Fusobacterium nucleatum CTI-5]OFQ58964.1 4-hydroxy-3-methylbut-2-enyl diphosphate reductase [Fusobacterium sp. HMSC065F01]QYR6766
MEIIRAKYMGFCFGVLEAINVCNSLVEEKGKKYILGMLVHNKQVVEDMQRKGFKLVTEEELLQDVDSLEENDIVVIRAHGTSKKVHEKLKERKVKVFDATCIFVNKIRQEIEIANEKGYSILFMGDRNHPEVKGVISFADDIQIFESYEEATKLKIDLDKTYLLSTQTTLNKRKFEEVKKFFKENYKNVIIFDKICGATAVRQKAVEDLAVKVELMIVVGDTKSSNTKKLYEISKKLNDNTYLIENEEQLNLDIFSGKKVVGITAGASTPEETIMNIEKKIRGIYKMSNVNENQNEFSQMLEEFLPNQEKRVEGVIESMDQNFSYLDVPGERTAVRVRTDELKGYKVGDTVEVLITGLSEEDDDQEYITASRKKIEVEKNWEKIEDSFKNKTILDAEVTKKIKGGYLVQALLYPGFLPNSLSEIPDNEEKVVGKKIQVIVKDIKVDPKDKRNKKITYSVKDIKIAEQEKEFAALEVGQIVDCVVTEVLDFGLAVDINTLKGFIHISEVSWKRLDKLSDIYKVGDHIKAVIVSLDEAKRNVKLSIKKLEEDPWATVANEFKVNDEVEGTVTKVLPYGAFVEIKPGIEGLVHISDFSWTKKKVNVSDYVKEGEKVKVRITDLHPEDRKLKLGIKQLVANPWETAEKDFAVGTVIKGKIVEVKPFGIFVEIADGIDAFVHSSDYNWIGEETPKFEIGNEVELKITELDLNNKKIKGSLKALRKSPWEHVLEEYKVGTTVEKKIKTVADFGLFIELIKGIDGFIPTQFASKEFIKNIRDKFKEGDIVKAQVVEVNKDTQKIKLSIKKIEIEEEKREEREQIEKYSTSSSEE